MCKEDTRFGEIIECEAKKVYGEGFTFGKCIIERMTDVYTKDSWWVVSFELAKIEKNKRSC